MVASFLEEFPSPCGDELILPTATLRAVNGAFPSPCGDELILRTIMLRLHTEKFPSPCGDELIRFNETGKIQNLEVSVPLRG